MKAIYEESVPVVIRTQNKVIGSVRITNGCCKDKPMMITMKTPHSGRKKYSCQCACGGWCTSGHNEISKALEEYESMNR